MRSWANIAIAQCSGVLLLSTVAAAQASERCEALKAELAQTPVMIGDQPNIRLYAGAITRQNFEIRKTMQNMQRLGCSSSVSVLDASGHDVCETMQTALAAMQANKQQMIEQRSDMSNQGAVNPHRQELLAALQTEGCNQEAATEPASPDAPRPFEAPLYPDYSGPTLNLRGSFTQPSGQNGYRTLCVRTCDGAFFPISPSTQPANFGRDAAQCQRMCPGTETELYYSRLSEEAEDMVSTVTGQRYRDQPNAFAYRNRPAGQPGQCGCQPASTAQSRMSQKPSSVINVTTTPAPKAEAAPVPTTPAKDPAPKPEQAQPYDAAKANVRQVGPAFFPTDSKAIDLKHPAQDGPQPVQ